MSPIKRPTAAEWHQHLTEILENQGLSRCELFPSDFRHIRFTGKPCPQCQLEAMQSVRELSKKYSDSTRDDLQVGISSKYQNTINSPSRLPSTKSKFGFKYLLTAVLVIVTFAFISILIGGASDPVKTTTNKGPTTIATAPPATAPSIPRSNSWETDVTSLIKGINSGAISVYPAQIKEAPTGLPAVMHNGSEGSFIPDTIIQRIEAQNIWWPLGNRLFVRFHNPSGFDISAVYFELTTTNCEVTTGRKVLLKLELVTPLRANSYAVYYGDLPFDYVKTIGLGVRCGTVVAAVKRENPLKTSSDSSLEASSQQVELSVASIQQYLERLGFDPGPIDGILGKKTRRAIQEFQISQGLAGEGLITPNLERELRSRVSALQNASQAPSGNRVTYVSVYVNSSGGAGWSAGSGSQREADSVALANCRKYGGSNQVCKKWFGNAARCVALARDSQGVFGSAWGPTEEGVRELAVKNCKTSAGSDCKLAGSLCG